MSHPPSLPLPSYKHGWCVCHLDCTSCSPGIRISSWHVFRRLTAAKVVTCIIMQKSGAPLHTALTLHWDTKTDGTSCVQVGTDTMDPWLDASVAELFGKLTCWQLRKFEACHVHKQEPCATCYSCQHGSVPARDPCHAESSLRIASRRSVHETCLKAVLPFPPFSAWLVIIWWTCQGMI